MNFLAYFCGGGVLKLTTIRYAQQATIIQGWAMDIVRCIVCTIIRGRALGGNGHGVRRSWQGALIMPPASRPTEPLTRNSFNSSRQKLFFASSWVTREHLSFGKNLLGRASRRWSENLCSVWGRGPVGEAKNTVPPNTRSGIRLCRHASSSSRTYCPACWGRA